MISRSTPFFASTILLITIGCTPQQRAGFARGLRAGAIAASYTLANSGNNYSTLQNGNYVYKPYTPFKSANTPVYLGKLSSNKYDLDSVSNPYGQYGSRYSLKSINNPYGQYGSPYSTKSINNPYTNGGPKLIAQDGTYLGRLNSNEYDPESISNPYGVYGSKYSPNSIMNPFGRYGNHFSQQSIYNPYATKTPIIISDD